TTPAESGRICVPPPSFIPPAGWPLVSSAIVFAFEAPEAAGRCGTIGAFISPITVLASATCGRTGPADGGAPPADGGAPSDGACIPAICVLASATGACERTGCGAAAGGGALGTTRGIACDGETCEWIPEPGVCRGNNSAKQAWHSASSSSAVCCRRPGSFSSARMISLASCGGALDSGG